MFRILKAFAWLRWRMLVNSLEKTGSRDTFERFSIAIEKLGPLLALILLVPSALFLAGLGVASGYLLATGGSPMPFTGVRFLLLPVPLLAVVGPLFLPAADRTNPVRMLLLPIPRATLYVAQASAAFGDPWIDPRAKLLVRDAFGYLEENPGQFDVIISDTTDPIGMAERLFSDEFYKLLVRALAPGGAAATQCEQPFFDTELIRTIYQSAKTLTKNPAYYYANIPTYPGGGIGFIGGFGVQGSGFRKLGSDLLYSFLNPEP